MAKINNYWLNSVLTSVDDQCVEMFRNPDLDPPLGGAMKHFQTTSKHSHGTLGAVCREVHVMPVVLVRAQDGEALVVCVRTIPHRCVEVIGSHFSTLGCRAWAFYV